MIKRCFKKEHQEVSGSHLQTRLTRHLCHTQTSENIPCPMRILKILVTTFSHSTWKRRTTQEMKVRCSQMKSKGEMRQQLVLKTRVSPLCSSTMISDNIMRVYEYITKLKESHKKFIKLFSKFKCFHFISSPVVFS